MTDNQVQSVIIILESGKQLVFSGKVQVEPEDEGMKIVGVKFTDPTELPEGAYWVSG